MQQLYIINTEICELCCTNKILCPVTLNSCNHTFCTKCIMSHSYSEKNGRHFANCLTCNKKSEIFLSRYYSLGENNTVLSLYNNFIGQINKIINEKNIGFDVINLIKNKYIALEITEQDPNKIESEFKYTYIGKCLTCNFDENNKLLSIIFSECYVFSEKNNVVYPTCPFKMTKNINFQNNRVQFEIKIGSVL